MKRIASIVISLIIGLIIIAPRFYNLGGSPPGLHIDEVSFASDAKAIAESGRDTWNVRFPRVFKAFGEWKAPGLTYSMAFWAKITGTMNNTVARLPSAIGGIFSLFMLVLTIKTLYPRTSTVVLGAIALLIAFSPWHFDMSRIFYEAFSAMSWLSLSLYLATRRLMLGNKVGKYEWVATIATAAIAGYYYASLRYVVIMYVIGVAYLTSPDLKRSVKPIVSSLLILLLIGAGWVGDLFSDVGLNRLHYYQQKSNFGAGLSIDEKRQFCYLSLKDNVNVAKGCYLLWNKPISKIVGAGETVLTYLGADFLFIHGESEYGFDSQYGAYLPPVIILYIVGLWHILKHLGLYLTNQLRGKESPSMAKVSALYTGLAFLSLVPAAAALNLNMRMAMISLYIVGIVCGIGLVEITGWLSQNMRPLSRYVIGIAFIGSMAFYTTQSLVHYFFVFTHSNDMQWTSDSQAIFGYLKTVSKDYDRIVDTELHGPLAPYFYGDITTNDVQKGVYSEPDDIGFVYLIKAGKYELIHRDIIDLACEKWGNSDHRRTLVISQQPNEDIGSPEFTAYTWNKVNIMRQVYDLDKVVAHQLDHNSSFKNTCTQK